VKLLVVAVAALALAGAALADSTPVGPLPKHPTTALNVRAGKTFTVTLRKRGGGLVWRIARPFDGNVVNEAAEGETPKTVWYLFATARGKTTLVFALTRGETRKAYAARAYAVTLR
jgi:hypothetical protein